MLLTWTGDNLAQFIRAGMNCIKFSPNPFPNGDKCITRLKYRLARAIFGRDRYDRSLLCVNMDVCTGLFTDRQPFNKGIIILRIGDSLMFNRGAI